MVARALPGCLPLGVAMPAHCVDVSWTVLQWRQTVIERNDTTMRFEWDEAKNERNIRRHGIDFAHVPSMFSGLTERHSNTICIISSPWPSCSTATRSGPTGTATTGWSTPFFVARPRSARAVQRPRWPLGWPGRRRRGRRAACSRYGIAVATNGPVRVYEAGLPGSRGRAGGLRRR